MSYMEPTVPDLLQDEMADIPAAPVQHVGPVRVQELPSTTWSAMRYAVTSTEAVKIADGNQSRRKVLLRAYAPVFIGRDMANAQNTGYKLQNEDGPLLLTHQEPIWARAEAASTEISVIQEYWTD